MSLVSYVGAIAAICTTGAFVPQIQKIRKQGGNDLSYAMLLVYLGGSLLWVFYGWQVNAPAVIGANIIATLLVGTAAVLKWQHRGSGNRRGRLRVAIDMDEVIADAFPKHLRKFNELSGCKLTAELVCQNGLKESIPDDYRGLFERIPHCDDFFADLDVIPGSQEAVYKLSQVYDIFIATAAMEVPESFDAKFKWLQRHFPFISTSHIVYCGDKAIVDADYLIDDRSRQFKNFRGTGILFTAPHNFREKASLRANNWNDVLRILLPEYTPDPMLADVAKPAQATGKGPLAVSQAGS